MSEQSLVLGRPYTKEELCEDMVEMRGYIKKMYEYIKKFNRDRGVQNLLNEVAGQ